MEGHSCKYDDKDFMFTSSSGNSIFYAFSSLSIFTEGSRVTLLDVVDNFNLKFQSENTKESCLWNPGLNNNVVSI